MINIPDETSFEVRSVPFPKSRDEYDTLVKRIQDRDERAKDAFEESAALVFDFDRTEIADVLNKTDGIFEDAVEDGNTVRFEDTADGESFTDAFESVLVTLYGAVGITKTRDGCAVVLKSSR